MTLEFSDCNNASLSYTLFGTGEDATPLTRLLPQGSGGCEAITGARSAQVLQSVEGWRIEQ
jgi:hypothetical protein